tara:strand:+ start:321 stop:1151 length:831 start_codon:yes stop_codon:yes gene_type:complete
MKAEIKLLTPKLAAELLSKNKGNRKVKPAKTFYAEQMRNGDWKENGEPIIIDSNGLLKDGQHRCYAVIDANYSYQVPIISGVDPDVMDTIDTGVNRGLNDVLFFNGFVNANNISSIVKGIISYNAGLIGVFGVTNSPARKDRTNYISNKTGLEYAVEHKSELNSLFNLSQKLYSNQSIPVFGLKEIAIMIYVISKYDPSNDHIDFMKNVLGIIRGKNNGAAWLYKKRLDSYMSKSRLASDWKINAFVKVWNKFVNGDEPVTYLKILSGPRDKPLSL